jgi:hypothetical protein
MVITDFTHHDLGEKEDISVKLERHDDRTYLKLSLKSDTVTLDETAADAIAQFLGEVCSDAERMLEFAWRFFPDAFEELKDNFAHHMAKFLESIDEN